MNVAAPITGMFIDQVSGQHMRINIRLVTVIEEDQCTAITGALHIG